MDEHLVAQLGDELFAALRGRRTLAPLTARHAKITVEDAYRISLHMLRRREAEGERVIGKKIGVTSLAVQEMLGVFQPDFGFLTDPMRCEDGASVSLAGAGLIQPRAEGEIAFMLKADLHGPGVTRENVLDATEWVAPCFEIVDSRIADWKIRIQDTVADNASCGVFVVGAQHVAPRALDRQLTAVGRVIKGMELLSTLPRGAEPMGMYARPEQRTTIKAIRLASDVPGSERTPMQLLRTDSQAFIDATEARRNRVDDFYKIPSGHIDLCNVPLPVRAPPAT